MFKVRVVILGIEAKDMDSMIRMAANYNLQGLYKIGVYGSERQDELFIIGDIWNYYRFNRARKLKHRRKAR